MKKKVSIAILVVMALSLVVGLVACADKEFVITFVTSGGSTLEDITFVKGDTPSVDKSIPNKEGFKFVGWYYDENLTKPFDKNNLPEESFTLYAKYEKLHGYVIKFETNGGYELNDWEMKPGEITDLSDQIPEKEDYVFDGWYMDEALTIEFSSDKLTGDDITVYAKWILSDEISVKFNTKGGNRIPSITFKRGEAPTLADVKAVKRNHEFLGWYLDQEYTTPYTKEAAPNKSFTVYAKYLYIKQTADFFDSLQATIEKYDLDKGFNIDMGGNISYTFADTTQSGSNLNLNFVLKGNFFNENKAGNNDMTFQILNKDDANMPVIALTNIGEKLYIVSGNNKFVLDGFNLPKIAIAALLTDMLPEGTNLGNLEISENMSINTLLPTIELATGFLGDGFKITWDKAGVYTVKAEVGKMITNVLNLVNSLGIPLPPEAVEILNQLASQQIAIESKVYEDANATFKGFDFNVIINNEGFKSNGTFDSKLDLVVNKINEELDLTGDKVTPSDAVALNIFGHHITTQFDLKNAEGLSIGKYNLTIQMDIDHKNLDDVIIEAAQTNSIYPVINEIFANKTGKIYIDLKHVCDESCGLGHMSTGFDGSILTVAYDPASFGNTRIYVTVRLKQILTQALFTNFGDVLGPILSGILAPDAQEYLALSLDVTNFEELLKLGSIYVPTVSEPEPKPEPEPGPEEPQPENPDVAPLPPVHKRVDALVRTLVSSITTDTQGGFDIKFADIYKALQDSKLIDESTMNIINTVVTGLLPNVSSISGTSTYENNGGFAEGFNGLNAFKENKNFVVGSSPEFPETNPIKGEASVKLDENGKLIINSKVNVFDENKNIVVTLDELNKFMLSNPRVKTTYTDILGNTVEAEALLMQIRGLDLTKMDVAQPVTLVLGRGVGSNLLDFIGAIGDQLSGISGLLPPEVRSVVKVLQTLAVPDIFVQTEITISNIVSTEWAQKGATANGNAIDVQKEYTHEDEFDAAYELWMNYGNGSKKMVKVNPSNANKYLTTKNGISKIKYYDDFTLEYKSGNDTLSVTVKVKEYVHEEVVTVNSNIYNFKGKQFNITEIGTKVSLTPVNKTFEDTMALNADKGVKLETVKSGFSKVYQLTFTQNGSYKATAIVNGIKINFTFNVTIPAAEGEQV